MKKIKTDIKTFMLSFGRALNISGLEKDLGLGTRTVRAWLHNERTINPESLKKIKEWASRYGWKE